MHPTAAALALRGHRLFRRANHDRGFAAVIEGHSMNYAYEIKRGLWRQTMIRVFDAGYGVFDAGYEEIAWSEIPDSLWATCDLGEAVRVLES